MGNRFFYRSLFTSALALACGGLCTGVAATAQKPTVKAPKQTLTLQTPTVSKAVMDGPYFVTLKLDHAQPFTGPNRNLDYGGGAPAVTVNGPVHPNHQLAVLVDNRLDKPVDHAEVAISYSEVSPQATNQWTKLPTARMVLKTRGVVIEYGNNVRLAPGVYKARVDVNGAIVTIPFTVQQGAAYVVHATS